MTDAAREESNGLDTDEEVSLCDCAFAKKRVSLQLR